MKKIAFDIDGVIVNTIEVFINELRRNGINYIPTGEFQIKTDPEISDDEIWKFFRQAYTKVDEFKFFDGALELMMKVHSLTRLPVLFVTARPIDMATEHYALMDRLMYRKNEHMIPYIIAFSSGPDKKYYLNDYQYFVEDRRKTALDLAVHQGKDVFVPIREYNLIENPPNRIHYIDGLPELTENLHIIL